MHICIYANCQGIGVAKLLKVLCGGRIKMEFSVHENYKLIAGTGDLDEFKINLRRADLFVYQPIGTSHEWFCTERGGNNLTEELSIDCQSISIPYVYNNGFWPYYREGGFHNMQAFREIYDAGGNALDAIQAYESRKLFFDILERTRSSFSILKEREASTDVKIANYMIDTYRDTQMLFTQNHPTSTVFGHIASQPLNRLGVKFDEEWDQIIKGLDANYAGLPGYYPVDYYCLSEGGISYVDRPDAEYKNYYHGLIYAAFDQWLNESVVDNTKHC
ncbi:WcbI family polysaccharide biosynthesis putative acetyltransferase [Methylobacterium sp. NEAU K]|uniref:WcbI family polysaccharide biosynthesis putative acetyltransferase n=1 Tax=Methylobacterium sp. NEAU K TaxID=3064946 RepID=UPI0027369F8D|nr:WcbI family polysaccharide biosynthesis putative acetyltransferase [Methylobacterium sp. NEAU K]MDP4002717.1 WcbI family polysaccharide biosynthesis putative acetyltransferase [Methylobacterium sp. NEAU K]